MCIVVVPVCTLVCKFTSLNVFYICWSEQPFTKLDRRKHPTSIWMEGLRLRQTKKTNRVRPTPGGTADSASRKALMMIDCPGWPRLFIITFPKPPRKHSQAIPWEGAGRLGRRGTPTQRHSWRQAVLHQGGRGEGRHNGVGLAFSIIFPKPPITSPRTSPAALAAFVSGCNRAVTEKS